VTAGRTRGQVTIAGYAQTPIVRRSVEPLGVLTVGAARAAIADAGLSPHDVDGFVTVGGLPSLGAHETRDGIAVVSAQWLVSQLGLAPAFVANVHGVGQLTAALATAAHAIAAGEADTVLVFRALHNPSGGYHDNPLQAAGGPLQWTAPQGYFGPLAVVT
jgi:acetyl-CoA acetyltransferase